MATRRISLDYDAPHIPMRHASWYLQLLMALAALVVAAVVYGFWRMAQAPSPTLDLPAGALEPEAVPPARPLPPTNEQAP